MGFVKIGDEMQIDAMLDTETAEDQIICPKCQESMTTIAFNEDGNAELVCQCDSPEFISESN